jgi:hypothetical protein
LSNINKNSLAETYFISLVQDNKSNYKNISEFLINKESIIQFKTVDYLLVLSKAIELTSVRFKIEEIINFSLIAIEVLGININDYNHQESYKK